MHGKKKTLDALGSPPREKWTLRRYARPPRRACKAPLERRQWVTPCGKPILSSAADVEAKSFDRNVLVRAGDVGGILDVLEPQHGEAVFLVVGFQIATV